MNVDEELLFIKLREALESKGWKVIAGQAARGSTDLPVVQARLSTDKGSKGAIKPDIVATRTGSLMTVELKPSFDRRDVAKCNLLMNSPELIQSLLMDLVSRRLWNKDDIGNPLTPTLFLTAVGYSGDPVAIEQTVCFAFNVSTQKWHVKIPEKFLLITHVVTSLEI